MKKLNVMGFAIAWGASFGVWIMILGWMAMFGWGNKIVDILSSLYIGYAPTWLGGIIGGVWGFFDWAIGAAIVAWIYNMFIKEPEAPAN